MIIAARPGVQSSRDGRRDVLLSWGSGFGTSPALTPDCSVVRINPRAVRSALCRKAEADIGQTADQVLSEAGIRPRRRRQTRDALLGQLLASTRIEGGWIVRCSPAANLLLSLIPFRVLVTYTGGLLTVRANALLKRRLLFSALKLEPDQIRHLGAG